MSRSQDLTCETRSVGFQPGLSWCVNRALASVVLSKALRCLVQATFLVLHAPCMGLTRRRLIETTEFRDFRYNRVSLPAPVLKLASGPVVVASCWM